MCKLAKLHSLSQPEFYLEKSISTQIRPHYVSWDLRFTVKGNNIRLDIYTPCVSVQANLTASLSFQPHTTCWITHFADIFWRINICIIDVWELRWVMLGEIHGHSLFRQQHFQRVPSGQKIKWRKILKDLFEYTPFLHTHGFEFKFVLWQISTYFTIDLKKTLELLVTVELEKRRFLCYRCLAGKKLYLHIDPFFA